VAKRGAAFTIMVSICDPALYCRRYVDVY
jgi:septin family protein